MIKNIHVSKATLSRLPRYLRILKKDGLVVLVWNRKCKGDMEKDRKVIVEKYRSIIANNLIVSNRVLLL